MECFKQNIPNTPVLQSLILISTLIYLPSNLLTNSEMRLEVIFLLDPKTKLSLSGSLDLMNFNHPFIAKYKCAV